jgi:arginine decarboxylase
VTAGVDQDRAPIYETLTGYVRGGTYGFHTPGHKGGRFAAAELKQLVGQSGLALDLPGMTATDNTFNPTGCVRDAQQLAAELFGAQQTFYLTAGSTLGIAASILAAVPDGGVLAMPRNVHRSVIAALVLTGAVPRFIEHDVLPECGALGVTPAALATVLDPEPRPAAVLLTRPSYYGLAVDLEPLAAVCHERGVPLIVDEAHGAHLHLLPHVDASLRDANASFGETRLCGAHPQPAIAAGADLAVQSCHKTLGSLVGSAQLHVSRQSLIEPGRVQEALNFLQTTSPSFLLLASLDLMRRWLAREGRELFAEAVNEAQELEHEIDAMPGLKTFQADCDARLASHRRDPLRLVVNVSGSGWDGYEVERFLRTEFKVEDEMADSFNVVYVLSPQEDEVARGRLLAGLRSVSEQPKSAADQPALAQAACDSHLLQPPIPPLAVRPRDAALGRKETVPLWTSAGRACAEMVMFYPPGIPLLMPGEKITEDTLAVCRQLLAAGAHPYASDPSLETVRVVA